MGIDSKKCKVCGKPFAPDLDDPDSLAVAIGRHVAAGAPRLAVPVAWLSWRDSAEQFWQRIDNCLAPQPDRSVLIG